MLKISLVTPNLNGGLFLESTLRSVENCGYPCLEHIVVDGGSTDNSLEIIERYQHRISRLIIEPAKGLYNAIRTGFEAASGDLFGWLNSDDLLLPHALHTINSVFQALPEANWISSLFPVVADQSGQLFQVSQIPGFSRRAIAMGHYLPNSTNFFGYIQQESTFWRSKIYRDIVGDPFSHLSLAGDYSLWTKLMEQNQLVGVPVSLGAFRTRAGQLSEKAELYLSEANQIRKQLPKRFSQFDRKGQRRRFILDLAQRCLRKKPCFLGVRASRENVRSDSPNWKLQEYWF